MSAASATTDTARRHHRVVDSPLGPLLLVGGPAGLVRIAFEIEDHDQVLAGTATGAGPSRADTGELDEPARQLDEYLTGRRRDFDLALDLDDRPVFRRRVLDQLRQIPYGHTMAYAGLAERAGNPRAVRAAATACATNPLPVIVPCHRVVRGDGSTGGYLGGERVKQTLLALEAP